MKNFKLTITEDNDFILRYKDKCLCMAEDNYIGYSDDECIIHYIDIDKLMNIIKQNFKQI